MKGRAGLFDAQILSFFRFSTHHANKKYIQNHKNEHTEKPGERDHFEPLKGPG
jgi:hypothetical protein